MGISARKRSGWLLTGIMVFVLISCIIPPLSSFAADDVWVVVPGGDPYWSTPGNWSLGLAPTDGDNVYLSPTNQNALITYDTLNNPTLNSVQIDGAGGYTIEVQQSQGSLTISYLWDVGYNGTAIYTQNGGNNSVTRGNLSLGCNTGSNGTYSLLSGDLSTRSTYVGVNGTGTFNQSGGDHRVSHLWVKPTGTYNLNGGTISNGDGAYIWGVFNHTDGVFSSIFEFDVHGTYNLSGDPNTSILNPTTLSGGEDIRGTFNQTGGNNILRKLDYEGASGSDLRVSGTYNLSGGASSAFLTVGHEVISGRESLMGFFNQAGGTHTVDKNLYIGVGKGAGNRTFNGDGTYNLSGNPSQSILAVQGNELIGQDGYTGIFHQSGGTHTVGGSLAIGDENHSSVGVYNLSGGSLTVMGGITNNGELNYSGGSLKGNLTNNGAVCLNGIGVRTITGDVTNNGTFKVTNTIAQYTGTFTNNGAYISDPTISFFNNLIIGQNGYLQGNRDDLFIISGYLENYSTNTLWNTSDSLLGFTGAGLHNIYDTNDVHWGTLAIYDGLLSLAGTGNLFVRNIFGLTFDQAGLVSNIWGNGLNIYYDFAYNPWLHGNTYSLMGGGSLLAYNTQAPVPEPSTMLLLGAGLLGLAGFRKRFKK